MCNLIVLTGLDGSGTTSVAEKLHKLDAGSALLNGINEPYSTVREAIDHVTRVDSPTAHYLFYLSANVHASFLIENALKSRNVYCVRHLIDTVVSHRVSGLNVDLVYETDSYKIRKPNLIVFLSVEEALRQERLEKRGKSYLDRTLDNDSFRDKFLKEFKSFSGHFKTVNVSGKTVLQIAEEIRTLMNFL